MELKESELVVLKEVFKNLKTFVEGGLPFIIIERLPMPPGCKPDHTDALLCPFPRDGYPSRLFVAEKIEPAPGKNWNANGVRIGDRNWYAVSWKVEPNLRLLQMVAAHLGAFR